ncbi:hypothetical protein TNCV_170121 [Trichonephila clavipes]|nr:hypothetical protein TNCV_170121 [Trichonephila clavipes]
MDEMRFSAYQPLYPVGLVLWADHKFMTTATGLPFPPVEVEKNEEPIPNNSSLFLLPRQLFTKIILEPNTTIVEPKVRCTQKKSLQSQTLEEDRIPLPSKTATERTVTFHYYWSMESPLSNACGTMIIGLGCSRPLANIWASH